MDRNFVWFLLIGLCAGWLAGRLSSGHGFGLFGSLIVGVVGAVVGGVLFNLVGLRSESRVGSLISATVGALVLIGALGALDRARARRTR